MARISSVLRILYSLPSSLISVPPYLLTSTRSPFLTSKGTFCPLSSVLPVLFLVHAFGANDRTLALFIAFGRAARLRPRLRTGIFACASFLGSGFVKLGGDGLPGFVQFVGSSANRTGVAALNGFFDLRDG